MIPYLTDMTSCHGARFVRRSDAISSTLLLLTSASVHGESQLRNGKWTSDLRDSLRRHKLEQYAGVFEANDIDLHILAELSDRDIGQLGLSLGNRRRLLKAIAGRDVEVPLRESEVSIWAAYRLSIPCYRPKVRCSRKYFPC
jgi:hypothetical protein